MNKRSGGISFSGVLLITFIVLKLCHVINWRWVWVLSPFWIAVAFGVILGICQAIANSD